MGIYRTQPFEGTSRILTEMVTGGVSALEVRFTLDTESLDSYDGVPLNVQSLGARELTSPSLQSNNHDYIPLIVLCSRPVALYSAADSGAATLVPYSHRGDSRSILIYPTCLIPRFRNHLGHNIATLKIRVVFESRSFLYPIDSLVRRKKKKLREIDS